MIGLSQKLLQTDFESVMLTRQLENDLVLCQGCAHINSREQEAGPEIQETHQFVTYILVMMWGPIFVHGLSGIIHIGWYRKHRWFMTEFVAGLNIRVSFSNRKMVELFWEENGLDPEWGIICIYCILYMTKSGPNNNIYLQGLVSTVNRLDIK